jgi:hypothetical protein
LSKDRLDSISTDREVSTILGETIQKPTAKYADTQSPTQYTIFDSFHLIEPNFELKSYSITFIHIENTSEFYVLSVENAQKISEYTQLIQEALIKYENSCSPYRTTQLNGKKSTPSFKIGDLLFTKYEEDNEWYRCFITDVTPESSLSNSNQSNDGFSYEVYFVDYGNKQKNVMSSNCRTLEQIKASKVVGEKELNNIFNLPFQAVCCELNETKASPKNTDTLKKLFEEFGELTIKVLRGSKRQVWPTTSDQNLSLKQKPIVIDSFIVELYSNDGKSLGKMFESLDESENFIKPVNKTAKILQSDNFYDCKVVDMDENGRFFVQLKDDAETIASLDNKINKFVQKSDLRKWKIEKPQQNQHIIAKLYFDGTEFNWYRAVVIKVKSNNKVDVFYFDYGNCEKDLGVNDILALPDEFDLDKYPMLAYPVKLNKVTFNADIDAHREFLVKNDSEVKLKIMKRHEEIKLNSLDMIEYQVEFWDIVSMKSCLNKIIDSKYVDSDALETEPLIPATLPLPNKKVLEIGAEYEGQVTELDIDACSIYYCLADESQQLNEIQRELNEFGKKIKHSNSFKINRVSVNDLVLLHEKDIWYRAIVTKVDDSSIQLLSIDHGLVKSLPNNNNHDIFRLPNEFNLEKHPAFVYKLQLDQVKEHIGSKTDALHFFTEKPSLIKIANKQDKTDKSVFIQYDVELWDNNPQLVSLNSLIDNKFKSKFEVVESVNEEREKVVFQKPLEIDQVYESKLCDLIEDKVYFYLMKEYSRLQILEKELAIYGSKNEVKGKNSYKPRVGDLVIAKFQTYDSFTWCRAVLTKISPLNRYDVYYFDYGNFLADLQLSDLIRLPEEYRPHKYPMFIYKVKFNEVAFSGKMHVEQIANFAEENLTMKIVKSQKIVLDYMDMFEYDIELWNDSGACFNKLIDKSYVPIDARIVEPVQSKLKALKEKMDNPTPSSFSFQAKNFLLEQSPLKPGMIFDCKINEMDDKDESIFYISLVDDLVKLAHLAEDLDLYGDNIVKKNLDRDWGTTMPQVFDIVLAKFLESETVFHWCRACITKAASPKDYEVFYFDYGNFSRGLTLEDFVKLPLKYDIKAFPIFTHMIRLNGVKVNLTEQREILADLISRSNLSIKILDCNLVRANCMNLYEHLVELWDGSKRMKECFNSKFDKKYTPMTDSEILLLSSSKEAKKPAIQIEKRQEILDTKSINKTPAQLEIPEKQIDTEWTIVKDSTKITIVHHQIELKTGVIYECRIVEMNELNEFYVTLSSENSNLTKFEQELNIYGNENSKGSNTSDYWKLTRPNVGDLVLARDNLSWYRGVVSQVSSSSKYNVFFIDYGNMSSDLSLNDLLKLPTKFDTQNFKIFSNLVQLNDAEVNLDKHGEFISVFYNSPCRIKVISRLKMDEAYYSINFFKYAVEIWDNDFKKCLNNLINPKYAPVQMLIDEADVLIKRKLEPVKKLRPQLLKLKIDELPKQHKNFKNEKFISFVNRIDFFYIFSLVNVDEIQKKVQETCLKILDEQNEFDAEQIKKELVQSPPQKDEIVYGKYYDDQAWYRCVITNFDHLNNKYEIFFIDFGNVEIVNREDLLYGWKYEHNDALLKYEPQAYKCKLYGLEPFSKEYSPDQNALFKQFVLDKCFIPKLIKINKENIYEISLKIVNDKEDFINSSAHYYLIQNKIGIWFLRFFIFKK